VPAAVVLAVLLWTSIVRAEKCVSLVFGNGAGEQTTPAIAGMLQAASFDEEVLRENLGTRS
jgi:hypothetical protein